jgi:DNA-binding CsgD family transcriptional regulator
MNDLFLGFHTAPYELYFDKEPDYEKIAPRFEMLNLFSEMNNFSICVIDFYKHRYAYVSKEHMFLCGYGIEEAKSYGESFVEKIIYEEDIIHQSKMKDAACLFVDNLDKERRENFQLYTTHRLKHKNGAVFMVSNKYKPIMFDDKQKMWLVLAITTLSTKNHNVESYIEIPDFGERHIYSLKKNAFIKAESIKLTEKENQILVMTMRGFTSKEIASKVDVSMNTIKFHKQKIMDKLNVQNMSEASLYAFSHNLF